jgi:dihydrofolate reductase
MAKLFWQISSTLDGFMEDPNGKLDRTAEIEDKEFEAYASKMLESIDAFIIGRKTYELFVGYWPTATGPDAEILNRLPKYVVSTTLDEVSWKNGHLIREDVQKTIAELKRNEARDIAVFGSAALASSLLEMGLIDECRVMITPFLLSSGNHTFKESDTPRRLELTRLEQWSSGTAFLTYTVPRD